VLRARAYQAASAAFARQDEPDAAWVAADRAIMAAEQSGEPLAVIAGHFRLAHAFIRLRHYDQAEHVATTAIEALTPIAARDDASSKVLPPLRAMHLVQAVICGHESNRGRARSHLAEATRVASAFDRNDYDTEFGPTNVQLHAVAVAVELGDAGEALDAAARVDASGLSPERQVRLLIDVARAHAQRHHTGEAIAALVDAEHVSPSTFGPTNWRSPPSENCSTNPVVGHQRNCQSLHAAQAQPHRNAPLTSEVPEDG
jgi:hypothetical protein